MANETPQDPFELDPLTGKKVDKDPAKRGMLAWFARNAVAANILMIIFLVGGAVKMGDIKQEVFPEFDLDIILVNVAYPGASPEEVEQGVSLALEEAVRGIDGVKKVRTTSNEGVSVAVIELMLGTDSEQALNDVKAAVDRVTSFPQDAERPVVFMARNRTQVISLVVYGDESEIALRTLAERARDELLQDPKVTTVELSGVRPYEIGIEVSQENLRKYNLTLEQVAGIIRQSSIELPGGSIKTPKGDVLLRMSQRRQRGYEFEDVVVVSRPDGAKVRLGELAEVKDGFSEADTAAMFNGKPAVMINVFRTGDQTPIDISDAVKKYIAKNQDRLPPGVKYAAWFDMSEFYRDRIDLLLRNAYFGLALVMLVLGLFLEIRLAFWVTMGIPFSFIGSLMFLPATDVSINMISLFAFILVLGMVVDDAIVVGEAVYTRRQQGMPRMKAAIFGVKEVATPVVFAIVTTIIAYLPMLFVPGPAGKFFRVIPIVVIIVLIMSLFESLLILPAHLAHAKDPAKTGPFGWIHHQQQKFSRFIEWQIEKLYLPVLRWVAGRRYLTFSAGVAILIASMGIIAGGFVKCTFLPKVEGDVIFASAEMPFGTAVERTEALQAEMMRTGREILEANGGEAKISRGMFSVIGKNGMGGQGDPGAPMADSGAHLTEVAVFMVPGDQRKLRAAEFARQWRKKLENVAGVDRLTFKFETGPSAGEAIAVELSHPDNNVLRTAAEQLAAKLADFKGAYDIDDGFEDGKEQLDLVLRPEARSVGLTEFEVAKQIRAAFYGAEAVRQQRGRDEVRVYVRLPRQERESEFNFEEMVLRTPMGGEIPLSQVAEVKRGRSYVSIKRIDGRRAIVVTSNVDESQGNANEIMAAIRTTLIPELEKTYPQLVITEGGEQREQKEVNKSLVAGAGLALLAMLALLAIAFRSYLQPIIIMLAIPFGVVGAILGHLVMGYDLSLMSAMGIVALSGVVVNDSLIFIVAINENRAMGMSPIDGVIAGGHRRFRPIILTSLTTFFGLAPMILETSVQARFLIPMAVSLGFGVMFATFITLILVPAAYLILEDVKRGVEWILDKEGRQLRSLTDTAIAPDGDDEPENAAPPTAS